MGIFDMVFVPCPHCGEPVEFQSKADDPYTEVLWLNPMCSEALRRERMGSEMPLFLAAGQEASMS